MYKPKIPQAQPTKNLAVDMQSSEFNVFRLVKEPASRMSNVSQVWGYEWDNYRLGSLLNCDDDILLWWRSQESQLPTLGLMFWLSPVNSILIS